MSVSFEISEHPASPPAALDTAATVARLGASSPADDAAVAQTIIEATAMFEEAAQRRLWYRQYIERLSPTPGRVLTLHVPAVSEVSEVVSDEDAGVIAEEGTEAENFRIQSSRQLFRASGWSLGSSGSFLDGLGAPRDGFLHRVGGASRVENYDFDASTPGAWKVTYRAGWWLASMGETPPAGVQKLEVARPDITRAIWEITEALWRKDTRKGTDPTVKKRKMKASEVEFFDSARAESVALPAFAVQTAQRFHAMLY